jgi:ankyrin repeat protein
MLVRGADVNLMLRKAMLLRDVRLLELAIKYNVSVNLPMGQKAGVWTGRLTCLNYAVFNWSFDDNGTVMIRRLLEAGADPLVKDENGKSAIHYACDRGPGVFHAVDDRRQGFYEAKLRAITGLFKEYGYPDV